MSVPERRPLGAFLSPLILQAQQGDDKAFDALYGEHRPAVLSWCIRLLGSEPEGEQAAQEVSIRAWNHLPRFQGNCPFKRWLYPIATSICKNILRTKKGKDAAHGLSLDGMEAGDRLLEGPGIEDTIVESLFMEQFWALIHDCVRTARPRWDAFDFDIFHLRYEQGIGPRDVGKRLGRSENTVKYRISHHIEPVFARVHARLSAEEETI